MTILYGTETAQEPVGSGMLDGFGNSQLTNVAGGCDLTYSGMDMTFDVAAGAVNINSVWYAVAAQPSAGTLPADTVFPRWAWITIRNDATASVVAGTPASNPAVPPLDYTVEVALALVLIPANQTIANTITVKLDKRIFCPDQYPQRDSDFTAVTNVTLADVDGCAFYADGLSTYNWEYTARCDVDNTPGIKFAIIAPASATATGQGEMFDPATVVADAQDDILAIHATRIVLVPASGGIVVHLSGSIVTSTDGGVVQLQAAQETSDAATITLYALGSNFHAWKVGAL